MRRRRDRITPRPKERPPRRGHALETRSSTPPRHRRGSRRDRRRGDASRRRRGATARAARSPRQSARRWPVWGDHRRVAAGQGAADAGGPAEETGPDGVPGEIRESRHHRRAAPAPFSLGRERWEASRLPRGSSADGSRRRRGRRREYSVETTRRAAATARARRDRSPAASRRRPPRARAQVETLAAQTDAQLDAFDMRKLEKRKLRHHLASGGVDGGEYMTC